MEMVKLAKNLANCYNLPKFFSVQYSIVKFFHIKVLRYMISSEIAASIPKYWNIPSRLSWHDRNVSLSNKKSAGQKLRNSWKNMYRNIRKLRNLWKYITIFVPYTPPIITIPAEILLHSDFLWLLSSPYHQNTADRGRWLNPRAIHWVLHIPHHSCSRSVNVSNDHTCHTVPSETCTAKWNSQSNFSIP